jgi:GNAT superfamily N-acetyltransferase
MIRTATPEDLSTILDLAEVMHAESRFKDLPFSRAKVSHIFAQLIDGAGLVLIAEQDGEVIGAIAGVVIELWFSPTKVAQDFGLFICPEHRGGMHAVRLIKRYIEWAKAQGATAVEMGINTGVQVEQTGKLLHHLGFTQVATLHSKEF